MDSLLVRFLKDGTMVIARPLSRVIKLFLHSSQIPEEGLSQKGPENYRPVSILSATPNILE